MPAMQPVQDGAQTVKSHGIQNATRGIPRGTRIVSVLLRRIHCHLCLKIKKARVKINHIPYAELNLVSQVTRKKRLRERLN